MRGLLRTVIANPLAVLLGAAALVLLGLYAAGRMPVDLFPNLDVPVVNIIAHYPGAAPEDLELLVTLPIEGQVRAIPGVRRVSSATTLGISQVTVEFTWGTTVTAARQQVEGRLAATRNLLPPGVEPVLESIGTTLQEVAGYLVIGPGDPVELSNTVRLDLTTRLMAIEGVAAVAVLGGDRRAFLVRASPQSLRLSGIAAGDLVRALRQNNLTAVGGYLERGSREYPLRGDARLQTLEDLRELPVTTGKGRVPLGAVAAVREGRVPRHYEVHGDGQPAVAFSVRKQPGADTLRVAGEVDRAVGELRRLFPADTRIEKYYDQSEIIAEARDEIVRDLLLGTVLAVLVLYLFLGALRPTLAVAATIPLSLIVTLALMRLAGLGFDVITLSALTLAVGMIIDDTVVVAENIFRHRQAGEPPAAATVAGAAEIAAADASGTFTTVAAFLPLLLITGLAALFLRPFGLTISAALLVSLAVSLTVIPLLFSRGGIAPPDHDFVGARILRRLDAVLQRVLSGAFRHPAWTLALAVLGFGLAGLGAFSLGPPALLPPIDEGAILIEYILPPGTALAESGRVGGLLDRVALAEPEVTAVYRRTGSPAAGTQVEGVNRGEILVKLAPRNLRQKTVVEITARLRQAYGRVPGVVFLFHQPTQEKIDESFSGLPALFGLTIFGPDPEILAELAAKAEDLLAAQPAVSNIVNNTKVRAPEILVRLDYRRLALHRVIAADVLTELQALRVGVEATRIVRQREEISILVQLAGEDAETVTALAHLPVPTAAGGSVPLGEVAQIGIGAGADRRKPAERRTGSDPAG